MSQVLQVSNVLFFDRRPMASTPVLSFLFADTRAVLIPDFAILNSFHAEFVFKTGRWRLRLAPALAVTWEQCDRSFLLESFAAAEANPSQATVDMVWQEWNSYLHNFFSVATSSFSQSLQGSSRTGLAAWSKKAEQAGSKTSKPHLQWIPKLVRRESGNMACRKRCNWLSRAERVLELMNKSSRSHNQDTELQRLMCRIRRRMPSTHEFPVFVRQLA